MMDNRAVGDVRELIENAILKVSSLQFLTIRSLKTVGLFSSALVHTDRGHNAHTRTRTHTHTHTHTGVYV